MPKGLTKTIHHTHILHDQRMVDEFYGRFEALRNPTQVSRAGYGDGHQTHEYGINLCHMQTEEYP